MKTEELSWGAVIDSVTKLKGKIPLNDKVYGIPRGGSVICALMTETHRIVDTPEEADWIIDDIVDSGATLQKYAEDYPDKQFAALWANPRAKVEFPLVTINVTHDWIVFPWEITEQGNETIEDNVRRVIEFIGDDPNRDGVKETPMRVAKMYKELFSGYTDNPDDYMKVFDEKDADGIIMVKDIQFFSMCEHHMVPFYGKCTVGYIPDGKIVGLSKCARIVNAYARRMQVQERLTAQIADKMFDGLQPKGVIVLMDGIHMCMAMRGVKNATAHTITQEARGVFLNPEMELKFLNLMKMGGP